MTTCTPLTCPTLGALDDAYQIAKAAGNWAEASRIWAAMKQHEEQKGCKK